METYSPGWNSTKVSDRLVDISEKVSSGLFLIVLGIFLFLNTSGIVSWSVWGNIFALVFRFWPIFIVILGVRIILGSSNILKILSNILWPVFFLSIFIFCSIYYSSNTDLKNRMLNKLPVITSISNILKSGTNLTESEIVLKKENKNLTTSSDVNVKMVAGTLKLSDVEMSDLTNTASLKSKYPANQLTPVLTQKDEGSNLGIDFKQEYTNEVMTFNSLSEFDLKLNRTLPRADISLDIVAGNSEINLVKIDVKEFNLKIVAGSNVMNFTDESLPSQITIEQVAGNVELKLPKSVGIVIESKSLAGNVKFNGEDVKSDSTMEVGKAFENRVVIVIKQTAGSININN